MQLEILEVRVASCLGRDLGDVQLVVHVAIEPDPFLVQGGDRLARKLERDRLVTKPAPADRLCDDRALVADDWIFDPCLKCIAADGLKHAAGHQHDVDTRGKSSRNRRTSSRAQQSVLTDQRAVEVACDGVDLAREILREVQPCGFVRKSTRALRSLGGRSL